MIRSLQLVAVTLIALGACSPTPTTVTQPNEPPSKSENSLPLADLRILRGSEVLVELEVEIAETAETRSRGLMNVDELPADSGMAFLFPNESRGGFWMKNTLIPLDIAFWDKDGTVVDLLQMTPCEADPCPSYVPSDFYVASVEANLGVLKGAGVTGGDEVSLDRRP